MSDPTTLRAEARAAFATGRTCLTLADDIERQRLLLLDRIEPVRAHHTPEVWASTAADQSRYMLTRYIGPGLWYLGLDLATTVNRLRDEASELESRAGNLIEAAVSLEAMALELEAFSVR